MNSMIVTFIVLLFALLVAAILWIKRLERMLAERDGEVVKMDRAMVALRQECEAEKEKAFTDAQSAVARSQRLIDDQIESMQREAERVRQHYETEARRMHEETEASLASKLERLQTLSKYEGLVDAESEAKRVLSEAMDQAKQLRGEARALLEESQALVTAERTALLERAKDRNEQADARLNQALLDAGRIVADAEKRAERIAGDAYDALKNKQMLEQAAEAIQNRIEGYGDKYLIPTHSLLDELAAEYGYDAAGQSLASARDQSRRMVEQGAAADCDYAEANRRSTAIQFVINAFNGSVDSILSRVKADNYGVLSQKIRDCFSIVNKDGSAFRNARILPTYLDARLAELKWAVIVQELAQRDREEQRFLREQERDRQKAEQERLKQLEEAEKEKELIRTAMEEAEKRFAAASAEQKAASEREVNEWRQKFEDATRKELTIAQQTNKGRIYVISNVGSFGDGVYKIGLTRRSVNERVDELGDASVPFQFDIHAVVETENAPALEFKIHQHFISARMNKVNMRKEFFRVGIDEIRKVIEQMDGEKDFTGSVTWTEKAKAQQYYESLDIDKDEVAKEKWLKRARAVAERRERVSARLSLSRVSEQELDNEEL